MGGMLWDEFSIQSSVNSSSSSDYLLSCGVRGYGVVVAITCVGGYVEACTGGSGRNSGSGAASISTAT
jgi:hypothetical protein